MRGPTIRRTSITMGPQAAPNPRALRALVLTLILAGGCLFDGHQGETSCEGCDAKTSYCSVPGNRDPDGGCQFGASCVPLPSACAGAPTCDCLSEVERAPYTKQGWTEDEIKIDCQGSAAAGFTVASTVDKCLP